MFLTKREHKILRILYRSGSSGPGIHTSTNDAYGEVGAGAREEELADRVYSYPAAPPLPASPSPPSLSHLPLELRKTLAIYDVILLGPVTCLNFKCIIIRIAPYFGAIV